ncbi:MAG: quinoprotein relay system zinc metallohydrolase 1 [Pseudomonadota bacterium]
MNGRQSVSRRRVLGGLAASVGVAAGGYRAAAKARHSYDLRPQEVADGIWMIEGAPEYFTTANGGAIVNCAIVETEAGLVIVDTGPSRRYGEAFKQALLQLSGRGIAEVIITHHHPDHFFGNQVFADRPIRALGETVRQCELHGDGYADNLYRLLGDWMRGTEWIAPSAEIAPGSFSVGGRIFQAVPLKGHSEADLALLDERTGTVIAGDLAFLDRAPTTPSADLDAWRESLSALEAMQAAAILPGHGPFDRTGESLRQTRRYLDWLEDTLRTAANDGLDMVEVMDLPLPTEMAQLGAAEDEFRRSVVHLFPRFEEEALPQLN